MLIPRTRLRPSAVLALGVAACLVGCATRDPSSFAKGASLSSVVQTMGRSTAEYASLDGGKELEYATGPYGKSTLLFRFEIGRAHV